MPDEAKADLDALVQKLKAEPNGAYIEIEGHTDNAGAKDVNYKLGLERAETVKRYLYEQHQVPLHRISIISYGEEKPIAPNNTRVGSCAESPRCHQGPDLDWSRPRGFASSRRGSAGLGAVDRERSAGGIAGMVRRHVRG